MLLRVRSGPDLTRFMETLRQHHRFSGSDRLFGLFSPPESAPAGLELHEDDIFGSEPPNSPMAKNPNPNANPNPSFSRFADHNFGILAALPDRNPNPNLMPKFSIPCSSSAAAMAIPSPPPAKEKQEKVYHSSVPVRIPVVNLRKNKGRGFGFDLDGNGDDDEEETMMPPPHEIVARRESSPMTAFSVVEGVGRTLKGRDLRRVRNAVFRRTGFED